MKTTQILFLMGALLFSSFNLAQGQQKVQGEEIHLSKLTLEKKKKHTFQGKDSILTVYIDTLIMKDKAALQFYGKKEVNLIIKHAEIGKEAVIYGQGLKNNGTNFDIAIDFDKLGSLYVFARGQNANNGSKTFPNGDGGNVNLIYESEGFTPQTTDKKAKHYIRIDNTEGGLNVTPTAEISNIYARIATSSPGLRGLPQGQIYSGSPGKKGQVVLKQKE